VKNRGAFDVERALVVAFSGNPRIAAAPEGTLEKPVVLLTRQMGHASGAVRGLHSSVFEVELTERPVNPLWVQACSLDWGGSRKAETAKIEVPLE
jgi:hypothetical protein